MNSELIKIVSDVLVEIIKENIEDITIDVNEDTPLVVEGQDFDSLQLVVFIGCTEEYFEIEFDLDYLVEDSFKSISAFAAVIVEHFYDQVCEKIK